MERIGKATWCTCGHYLGGLAKYGQAIGARDRYAIHRVRVLNAER
jgi:hypothetical protein